MKKAFAVLFIAICLSACGAKDASVETFSSPSSTETTLQEPLSSNQEATDFYIDSVSDTKTSQSSESGEEESILRISVGEHEFEATFENNPSAIEFQELLKSGPITIEMKDYGGFEKVGDLGTTLTRSDEQITTKPGDIILYQGNQITIYYAPNTWNFTKLAKINDTSDLYSKLGTGTVQVTFSLDMEA